MARTSLNNVIRLINEVTHELPAEQSFLADLKRSIEITDAKGIKTPTRPYKPSSMGCIRSMYYQLTGTEPDKTPSSYMMVGICNSGTDIHVRVQKAIEDMKNNGIECEYIDVAEFVKSRNLTDLEIISKNGMETKLFHKKLNMRFMCDGIIKYKNHYYILELKTEASFKFNDRKDVDPKHYNQGTAYSIAFGLDEVLFVYISRDVLDMKAYMLTVTDEMKQNLIGKITECDGYVERHIAPPIPDTVPKRTCSYCSYKETCRKG